MIVMSSGKAVQPKDDGESWEEEVYSRKRNLEKLPRSCLIGDGFREGEQTLSCFMTKGQLPDRCHRQTGQCDEEETVDLGRL